MANKCERDFIAIEEVKRFIVDCLVAVNTPKKHAELMADLLATADYRGHFSHGMNRIALYVDDIQTGGVIAAATPTILNETPATAWVDGNAGLGAVVGRFCMDLAIKKAKNVGIGWVSAKNSNHYGICGWHSIYAQKQGLIGISMTNGSALLCPTRSKVSALGTNPVSLAASANNGDSFVLDMAVTSVAMGKIEMQKRKEQPIPSGWALDRNGDITTDPQEAIQAGRILPLGGFELTSGYKGYGLSAMNEILTGILSGASYASQIRQWGFGLGKDGPTNNGQLFIAIDPNCFAPGFEDRMTDMNSILRNLPPVDETKPVLVPGDPERLHMKMVDDNGGIPYHINQLSECDTLAETLNVPKIGTM